MKKLLGFLMIFIVLVALVPPYTAQAQSPEPMVVVEPGLYPNCLNLSTYFATTLYRKDMLCAPLPIVPGTTTPVVQKNEMVVYAHGYVKPGPVVDFPMDQLVLGGTPVPLLITGMGYWFATTTYHENGLAVQEGLMDLTQLTQTIKGILATGYLPTNPPVPLVLPPELGITLPVVLSHTYLIGVSEGGWITALAAEQFPLVFSGGLAMCGPVGDFRKQANYFGDFRVVFDYYFPGILPNDGAASHDMIVPDWVIDNWGTGSDQDLEPAVLAQLMNPANAGKLAKLLKVTNAPYDTAVPATMVKTAMDILWYDIFANNDARTKLGGQPFNNKNKWYTGTGSFAGDVKLNKKVFRVYDPNFDPTVLIPYNTTGKLMMPLVSMHTTKDDVIPYWHEALYLGKVIAQGKLNQFLILPVNAYGHCNFTQQQAVTAFGLLVYKVTGQLPSGFSLSLPTSTQLQTYKQNLKKMKVAP